MNVGIQGKHLQLRGYWITIFPDTCRWINWTDSGSTRKEEPDMRRRAQRIVEARIFGYFLVILIIATAVLRGLATSDDLLDRLAVLIGLVWLLTLAVLVLEALLKMFAASPRVDRYFRDPWNVFDFVLIGLAFYYSDLAILIVTVRLLRLLRGFSAVREMNLILSTLVRSVPSMVHIVVLLGIIVYMYAIVGHGLFHEHDPARWGTLGVSILSLFQVVTLDDWTAIMDTATELEPLAWFYFVSFVIVATFVGINLFVAIVVKNMDEVNEERLRRQGRSFTGESILSELRATQSELGTTQSELRATQQSLQRVEEQLQRLFRGNDG